MIVIPIVISTLIVGIAGVGDAKSLAASVLRPLSILKLSPLSPFLSGWGLPTCSIREAALISRRCTRLISPLMKNHRRSGQRRARPVTTILSLILANVFDAMAKGNILAIIFFSVLFGLGLSALPEENKSRCSRCLNLPRR